MTVTEAKIRKIERRLSSLEETVEILADKKLLKSIRESLEDIKAGRYTEYENLEDLKADTESKK